MCVRVMVMSSLVCFFFFWIFFLLTSHNTDDARGRKLLPLNGTHPVTFNDVCIFKNFQVGGDVEFSGFWPPSVVPWGAQPKLQKREKKWHSFLIVISGLSRTMGISRINTSQRY